MIAPRWHKVWRDLLLRRGRSLLVVLAMAAAVFEITTMLDAYALLRPELASMYGRTHPASATLVLDRVSDALVDSIRRVPGVAAAEARPIIIARVRVGDEEWVPAVLAVVRDFGNQRIDTFDRESGNWPPGPGEILLERTALRVAQVASGGNLTVRLAGGREESVRVAGTVHADGLPPAWMEHMVPGFVAWNSTLRGDGQAETAQVRIIAEHPLDEGFIREVADSVRARLESQGHVVSRVSIPDPGRHPHAGQMEAFLFLLLAFGVLSFALSTVLVAGTVHALMNEQVKQVGMMKAIGATSRQVAGIYLAEVSLLAAASLVIGLPVGILVGQWYARFSAGILNVDITHSPFPGWLIAAEAVVGILVPVAVALLPVARAARITVHQALCGDPDVLPFGARPGDRWLGGLAALSRPLALTMRTTLARRGRLAVTVTTLAIGGGAFMAALNVSGAWTHDVDADFAARGFDLSLGLAHPQPIATVRSALAAVPGIERAEHWSNANAFQVDARGVAGMPVVLVGPQQGSQLLRLPLTSGRWLKAEDRSVVVVNQAVMARDPALRLGDRLRVRVRGRTLALPIVGVVKELSPMAMAYAPASTVRAAIGQSPDSARSIEIVTRRHDEASVRAVARRLEGEFEQRGIEVSGLQRMLDARQGILDHLVIVMSILTLSACVIVFVGALGLSSTLTLNVVQRTREFGILGAIGATPGTIARHVWFEGVLIGVMSWVVALVVTLPLSYALEAACGRIFFKSPLGFHVSPVAVAAWLAVVLVLASLSSIYPARRAARLTVSEALGHV